MDKEKDIEKLKLIIAENMATYSKAKMPYDEALRMCALGILASGYGNVEQAVREFANNIIDLLDEMGMERSSEYNDGYDDGVADCITNIKSRLTELYGLDE